MTSPASLEGFEVRPLAFRGKTRDVLVSQTAGRPIILLHELYGLTQTVIAFARRLTEAGYRVYVPVMFGSTDPNGSRAVRMLALPCIVAEFRALSANDPGPWADWVRDLASYAFEDCKDAPSASVGGRGVGVIGLCLTGNLALSAALNPLVTAPVMSEPALPGNSAGGLHISATERAHIQMRVADQGLLIRGYRYQRDAKCKAKRFEDLDAAFQAGFLGTTIPTQDKALHSVFTEDYLDEAGAPRHGELQTLLDYLAPRI